MNGAEADVDGAKGSVNGNKSSEIASKTSVDAAEGDVNASEGSANAAETSVDGNNGSVIAIKVDANGAQANANGAEASASASEAGANGFLNRVAAQIQARFREVFFAKIAKTGERHAEWAVVAPVQDLGVVCLITRQGVIHKSTDTPTSGAAPRFDIVVASSATNTVSRCEFADGSHLPTTGRPYNKQNVSPLDTMNSVQSNRLAMYNAVVEFLRGFVNSTTATSLFPALAAKFAMLITLVEKLVGLADQQEQPVDGKLENRAAAFRDVTQATIEVAGAVLSYARTKRRHDLAAQVRRVRTEIRKMRIGERTRIAQRVHDVAAPLATELAEYGLTAAMLQELQDKIDATVQAVNAPIETNAVKKVSTSQLSRTFAEIDDLLAEIDPMLVKLQSVDLATYERYLAARAVFARPGARQDASGTQSAAEPVKALAQAPASAERQAA